MMLSGPMARLSLLIPLALLCSCSRTQISIQDDSCPLPESLSSEYQKSIYDFSIGAQQIAGSVGSASGQVKLEDELNRHFAADAYVNRIYALVYAQCVACRIIPDDKAKCLAGFEQIVLAMLAALGEPTRGGGLDLPPAAHEAIEYKALLDALN